MLNKFKKNEIKDDENVEEVKEVKEVKKKEKIFILRLKNNCSHELHLSGRIYHVFAPNGIKEVPESILKHKDFTDSEAKYYVIKEKVKKKLKVEETNDGE